MKCSSVGVVFFETPSSPQLASPDLNADQGAAGGWSGAGPVACSPDPWEARKPTDQLRPPVSPEAASGVWGVGI